jgi:hypothetical protein
LLTLKFVHPNACLLYLIFYMSLTLKNLSYLFKNFILRITSFLNFIPFYFMLRISWQRKCFFSVGVEMVYMFCPSCLQRHYLKFSHLHYLIFYMFLTLKNLSYLFKNFVLRITSFFFNFIPFYFLLRISWQRKCFFSVRVEMVYMFCPRCLQRHYLKFSHLHVSLLPLMCGIIDLGIPVHVLCIFCEKLKGVMYLKLI